MKEKMITARIDQSTHDHLNYLKRNLGLKYTSEVLIEAVEFMYKKMRENQTFSSIDLFEKMGLVGSIEEEPNLSETYKEKITDALSQKHRPRKRKLK